MPVQAHTFVTLFFILWFGMALANVIAPRFVWKMTQSWKAFREPPKAYFLMQRVIALIMILVGLSFLRFTGF
ncbi:hypothetical protein JZ785_25470 [Alicyclobacillus curvatus]|nr:hypothetical protein JZ785_25470 [Alicyclobacillus curvatus]